MHVFGVEEGESSEPFTCVEDPAALLVRSKDLVWLAIVEIYDIKQGGKPVDRLPARLLTEPNIRVTVQICHLRARAIPDDKGDWEWYKGFEKVSLEVEGCWLQLLNPEVIYPSQGQQEALPRYAFNSSELVAIACLLYGKFCSDADRFPSCAWTDRFPYRTQDG